MEAQDVRCEGRVHLFVYDEAQLHKIFGVHFMLRVSGRKLRQSKVTYNFLESTVLCSILSDPSVNEVIGVAALASSRMVGSQSSPSSLVELGFLGQLIDAQDT